MNLHLPTDRELFPQLYNGTAEPGLKIAFHDGMDVSTNYDSVSHSSGDLEKEIREKAEINLDRWLDEYTEEHGVKSDAPSDSYDAFALRRMTDEEAGDSTGKHYDYMGYTALTWKKRSGLEPGWKICTLSPAVSCGNNARIMLNQIPDLLDQYRGDKSFVFSLLVPLLFAGALLLNFSVEFTGIMRSVMILGLPVLGVLAILAMCYFIYVLKLYLAGRRSWRSEYKNRKEFRQGIEKILLQAHRSIRYRRILLSRMASCKAEELEKAEEKLKKQVRAYEEAVSDRTRWTVRNTLIAVVLAAVVIAVLAMFLMR